MYPIQRFVQNFVKAHFIYTEPPDIGIAPEPRQLALRVAAGRALEPRDTGLEILFAAQIRQQLLVADGGGGSLAGAQTGSGVKARLYTTDSAANRSRAGVFTFLSPR